MGLTVRRAQQGQAELSSHGSIVYRSNRIMATAALAKSIRRVKVAERRWCTACRYANGLTEWLRGLFDILPSCAALAKFEVRIGSDPPARRGAHILGLGLTGVCAASDRPMYCAACKRTLSSRTAHTPGRTCAHTSDRRSALSQGRAADRLVSFAHVL